MTLCLPSTLKHVSFESCLMKNRGRDSNLFLALSDSALFHPAEIQRKDLFDVGPRDDAEVRVRPRQRRRRRFEDRRRRESFRHVQEGRQRLDRGRLEAVDV